MGMTKLFINKSLYQVTHFLKRRISYDQRIISMFVEKLENDAALRGDLRAAGFGSGMSVDAVIAFANSKGYTFGDEELGQLTDQELGTVAGGGLSQEMGELRMQQLMDRQSKNEATLSNLMKAMSTTSGSITSNIK